MFSIDPGYDEEVKELEEYTLPKQLPSFHWKLTDFLPVKNVLLSTTPISSQIGSFAKGLEQVGSLFETNTKVLVLYKTGDTLVITLGDYKGHLNFATQHLLELLSTIKNPVKIVVFDVEEVAPDTTSTFDLITTPTDFHLIFGFSASILAALKLRGIPTSFLKVYKNEFALKSFKDGFKATGLEVDFEDVLVKKVLLRLPSYSSLYL